MRVLADRTRTALALAAFGAFGCAFSAPPDDVARAAAATAPASTVSRAATQRRLAAALVLPRRDPFSAAVARPAQPDRRAAFAPAPAGLPVLPPNAGAPPYPFAAPLHALAASPPTASAPRSVVVKAVVTGPRPVALVVDSGTTRLITVGDRIAGAAIAAIDAGGVRLADGTLIPVAPSHARFSDGGP